MYLHAWSPFIMHIFIHMLLMCLLKISTFQDLPSVPYIQAPVLHLKLPMLEQLNLSWGVMHFLYSHHTGSHHQIIWRSTVTQEPCSSICGILHAQDILLLKKDRHYRPYNMHLKLIDLIGDWPLMK